MIDITLRQLRYFDALADQSHFGHAAAACGISQPALSMQIKELEEALGAVLIERGARQVRLTKFGEEAVLRVRAELKNPEVTETVEETFKLRRTKEGWKAYENRGWPVTTRAGAKTIAHNAAYWKEKDAQIEAARRTGNRQAEVRALSEGFRFAEAYKLLKDLTAGKEAQVADWVQRGSLAVVLGDAKDAEASFKKALLLDEKAPVPDYARP